VALTFDLCPVRDPPGFDAELAALLENTRTPATFFISGRWLLRHENEAKALAQVPFFELGTHGFAHAHLPILDGPAQREEIEQAVTLLRTRLGVSARLFRPPYGEYDERTEGVLETLGLRGLTWSVVSGDPDPELSAAQILDRIERRLRPGSIVVFHANGKGRHTRAVVQALLERLLPEKGLRPMTVDELLECRTSPR
jgi:peptidoglycan/xylan/chitin deacetylase (PgdA/CDA1 family)